MIIFCCTCNQDVEAELANGQFVYPRRADLYELPFWLCPTCHNSVGCHHKTSDRTKPLGVIPSIQIKNYRKQIHEIMDPIWKLGLMPRGKVYAKLSKSLDRPYHTAEIRTQGEAELIIEAIKQLRQEVGLMR